jgi:hypothetical protein
LLVGRVGDRFRRLHVRLGRRVFGRRGGRACAARTTRLTTAAARAATMTATSLRFTGAGDQRDRG